jgi:hypothetical protein
MSNSVPRETLPPNVQRLIDDLYFLFTHDPTEIAEKFGESRVKNDSARVNYAIEWLADYVSEDAL